MNRFEIRPPFQGFLLLLPVLLLTLALSACGNGGGEAADGSPADDAATVEDSAVAVDETAAGEDSEADAQTDNASSEGMISSGTAQAPPPVPTPAEPEQSGVTRLMTLPEAAAAVPFQAYEPGFLPEGAAEPVVMLIAARNDEIVEGLPAINMIYTVDAQNTFRVYQSAAGDRPYPDGKESSPATIGEAEGQLIRQGVTYVLGWEVGDTRLEIHSKEIPTELMQEIAEGLRPFGSSSSGQ
jgi:hypothetical protein